MLARQRSGTHALREILDRHADICCMPEVFHAEPVSDLELEANFFRFLDGHPDGTIWRSTSLEAQERIFLDFLDHLRAMTAKRYVLIDVKLSSTHHLDGPWRALAERPNFFKLFDKHRLRTLTVTRRNYLRWYLSWQKAERTDTWHAYDAPAPDAPIELDVENLLWNLGLCKREDHLLELGLPGGDLQHCCEYTDLFPELGGPASDDVLAAIAAWLDVEPAFPELESGFSKLGVLALPEAIANYDEVAAALTGTEFEYCLEDEPMYRGQRSPG